MALFQRGHRYWAGVDKPFFVTEEFVETLGQNAGFIGVDVFGRTDAKRPNPGNVSKHDPDESWNVLVTGVWPVNDQDIDLPDRVRWVEEDQALEVDVPGATKPGQVPGVGGQELEVAKPTGLSPLAIAGIVTGGVVVVGMVALLVVSSKSSRRANPRRRRRNYGRPTFRVAR